MTIGPVEIELHYYRSGSALTGFAVFVSSPKTEVEGQKIVAMEKKKCYQIIF